jgi:hypothetical protein
MSDDGLADTPLALYAVAWIWVTVGLCAFLAPITRINPISANGVRFFSYREPSGVVVQSPAWSCSCSLVTTYEAFVAVAMGSAALFGAITLMYGSIALPDASDEIKADQVATVILGSTMGAALLLSLAGRHGWRLVAVVVVTAWITTFVRNRTSATPSGEAFSDIPALRAVVILALGAVVSIVLMCTPFAIWISIAVSISTAIVTSANVAGGDWAKWMRAYREDLVWPLIETLSVLLLYALYEQHVWTYHERGGQRGVGELGGGRRRPS